MKRQVKTVAVLGAGVMGAQIAGHFANAGIDALLLDIVPRELTDDERKRGLTLQDREVRTRLARHGVEGLKKAKPAPLYLNESADSIELGNLEDDLGRLAEVDWIIEAVIENLEIKRQLLKRVDEVRKPGTLVSTNTSGIPIHSIAEGLSDDFRAHWFGTHFFNPVRYMKLLEIIPTPETNPGIVERIRDFSDRVLGKGIIVCKNTPNFVANRIGTFDGMLRFELMMKDGYSIEEMDAISGKMIGRPKPGRSADMIGIDTMVHVANNLYDNTPHDERRQVFKLPAFITQMVENRWLGDKNGQGFYKKVKGPEGSQILALDFKTMEYKPKQQVAFVSLDKHKQIEDIGRRLAKLVYEEDRAGRFLWKLVSETLVYSARRIPEIADDILAIDQAMRWGYNWALGPFETWDAIGVEQSVAKMRSEGVSVPENVAKMLARGITSFYQREKGRLFYYDFGSEQYQPAPQPPGTIVLSSLKERNKVVEKNSDASLIDIGDGVLLVEFHSKMNAIGDQTIAMLRRAVEAAEEGFEGIVVGNQGEHFSVGANLMLFLMAIENRYWQQIDEGVKAFQDANMMLKYAPKPVVCAVHGLALGGGCEVLLHAQRVQAAAETYIGEVEVGVGLVPAGGGTKEFLLRCIDQAPAGADLFPFVRRAFETVAMAKVATSAFEAKKFGFFRDSDGISLNKDRLLEDAKQVVLAMAKSGHQAGKPRTDIPVLGDTAMSTFKLGVHMMRKGNYISEYDAHLATKVAHILTGGGVHHPAKVSEQYLLDLEREAFLSLCGQEKTIERIKHVLMTNKPLRN